MTRRLRFAVRHGRTSATGQHVHCYGLRFGYWPCLAGWFIGLDIAIWRIEVWHGLPSYEARK